jgi:Uma2 family endonuclease
VCEVLSPRTSKLDRSKKMPVYAREHVGHAWLIDPIDRVLEVHRLENGRWSLLASYIDDAIVRAEPFDAIELELGRLWADLEPGPAAP